MSALLTRGSAPRRVREADCRAHAPAADDGPTLDDVVSRAWEVLRAGMPATCPACAGELLPLASTPPVPGGGRCGSCGATLS